MSMIVIAMPIPADKYTEWRTAMSEFAGPRREEYTAARTRQGVTRQGVFVHHTPQGPMEIMVMEADDPARALELIGSSGEPFDVEFRAYLKSVFDLDLSEPPPGPLPEQVLGWRAPRP
ncbi:hypothetical protein [Actinomycetospora sp. TBRC 11914]|uniref:hypothetical protein n=1 Tax=Actinomycetospora sp. TBRC 11914 TaxID=2729387 RepID=UPI00145F3F95|nr:hypothetical protein [Actinomycetospora sp. TBRC 11914]NMO91382.1 hypothetical protein [Actinomycetospora sp. TBRC 11914]